MKKWCGIFCVLFVWASAACNANVATVAPAPTQAVVSNTDIPARTDTMQPIAPSATPMQTVAVANTVAPTPTFAATFTLAPTATRLAPTDMPAQNTTAPTATTLPTKTLTPIPASPTALHGDANAGAIVFQKKGCKGCHMPPPNARRIAPDLSHINADAEQYIHSTEYHGRAADTASYIRESILNPNAFVVPPYRYLMPDGSSIMPQNFGTLLSVQELDNVIAYVLTLAQ